MGSNREARRAAARTAMSPLYEACEGVIEREGQPSDEYVVPVVEAQLSSGAKVLRRVTDGGIEVSGSYTRTGLDGVAVAQYVEMTFPAPVDGMDLVDTHVYAEGIDGQGLSKGTQGLRRYPELAAAMLELM